MKKLANNKICFTTSAICFTTYFGFEGPQSKISKKEKKATEQEKDSTRTPALIICGAKTQKNAPFSGGVGNCVIRFNYLLLGVTFIQSVKHIVGDIVLRRVNKNVVVHGIGED